MNKYSEALLIIVGTLITVKLGVISLCIINEALKTKKDKEELPEKDKERS